METVPRVLVTGANGFIASHVCKMLLSKGYRVVGTVRDPSNEHKVGHLKAMDGAGERLELVAADLLDPHAFDEVVKGVSVVYHTASPFFYGSDNPETDLLKPAQEGTLSVLRSIAAAGTKPKVVLTSSIASVYVNGGALPPEHVYTESDWSDEALMRERGIWYPLSKTLAERAAWSFLESLPEEEKFQLAVINPVLVTGEKLQKTLNTSAEVILKYLDGSRDLIPPGFFTFVDVVDVAAAHVAAGERAVTGRFICCGGVIPNVELAGILRSLAPAHASAIPTEVKPGEAHATLIDASRAERELGITYTSAEDSMRNTVKGLLEQGNLLPKL